MRLSESERKQWSKRRGVHRDKKQAYIEGGEGGRKGGEREGGRLYITERWEGGRETERGIGERKRGRQSWQTEREV